MPDLKNTTLHIGFDDTDSLKGGCTTYLALRIIELLAPLVNFIDYPRLIRNNPNIPWKTRGNGAICLTLKVNEKIVERIARIALETLNELLEEDPNTNPGMAFVKGEIPEEIIQFSREALTDIIEISTAKDIAEKFCFKYYSTGNGRGLIGAIAAIGNPLNPLDEDFTFELLTYRKSENISRKRILNEKSVAAVDNKYSAEVFNNIDEESKKVIIAPAGLDPVLYGIRGENPLTLLNMMGEIEVHEPISSYCIFRTNQGTDQHFKYASSEVQNFNVFKGEIRILETPKTILGGHVIFRGEVISNKIKVDVAAFEPSKSFRNTIRELLPEDKILAYGGVRYKKEFQGFTVQLEKCEIIFVSEQFREESPLCPSCSKRMVSNGLNKGYKCRKCGHKSREIKKNKIPVERRITTGLYIPPAQSQRHLIKPNRRYNLPQKDTYFLIENWWKVTSKSN
ncbi:MAG: DUF1743 domain-containing protein [Candidatus Heimdallarchaeota archaeon]|nr:DUF1743 domain-containing protein [Candidatus Heimdallarchaeota archaeon]